MVIIFFIQYIPTLLDVATRSVTDIETTAEPQAVLTSQWDPDKFILTVTVMSHMPAQVPVHITFTGFLPPDVASLLPQPVANLYVLSMPAYLRKRKKVMLAQAIFREKHVDMGISTATNMQDNDIMMVPKTPIKKVSRTFGSCFSNTLKLGCSVAGFASKYLGLNLKTTIALEPGCVIKCALEGFRLLPSVEGGRLRLVTHFPTQSFVPVAKWERSSMNANTEDNSSIDVDKDGPSTWNTISFTVTKPIAASQRIQLRILGLINPHSGKSCNTSRTKLWIQSSTGEELTPRAPVVRFGSARLQGNFFEDSLRVVVGSATAGAAAESLEIYASTTTDLDASSVLSVSFPGFVYNPDPGAGYMLKVNARIVPASIGDREVISFNFKDKEFPTDPDCFTVGSSSYVRIFLLLATVFFLSVMHSVCEFRARCL